MHDNVTSTSRRIARLTTAGVGLGLFVLAGAAPALADPPGNNGTIKIDGVDFDTHSDNEPHVGCSFQVDFYGFDEGELNATVTFEAQAPTGSGTLLTDFVFIGEDDNSGGGSPAGLDAEVEYDLSAALATIEPHPVQGHHVKLTIEADGSQGAKTKHKVFWVEGCTPPVDEPPVDEPPVDEPPAVQVTPPADPGVPEVLGTTVLPQQLPRTGTSTVPLAAAGTALVALGIATRRMGVRLAGR